MVGGSPDQRRHRWFIETLRVDADIVDLCGSVAGIAAHVEDDPILETAVAGRADYLVTGDHGLLALDDVFR